MEIFDFYSECTKSNFPYTDVYYVFGNFVTLDTYLLYYNFYTEKDYDGLLSYLAFNQHVAYLMDNIVLAEKYKSQIDTILNKMKCADSDIQIYKGNLLLNVKPEKYAKEDITVLSESDIQVCLQSMLLNTKTTKDSLLFVSNMRKKVEYSIYSNNQVVLESNIVAHVYNSIVANILPVVNLFKQCLCNKLRTKQINLQSIRILDKLNIKEINKFVQILSEAILDIENMELILSKYDLDIQMISKSIIRDSSFKNIVNPISLKTSNKDSIQFTSLDIKNAIMDMRTFLENNKDLEIDSILDVLCTEEKLVLKQYLHEVVTGYVKYTNIHDKDIVFTNLYKELDSVVKNIEDYSNKQVGQRTSKNFMSVSRFDLLDFTIGTIFDINGTPESMSNTDSKSYLLGKMDLYEELNNHVRTFNKFIFLQNIGNDIRDLISNISLADEEPELIKNLTKFVYAIEVVSYIQNNVDLKLLEDNELNEILDIGKQNLLELIDLDKMKDLFNQEIAIDSKSFLKQVDELQNLAFYVDKLLQSYTIETDIDSARIETVEQLKTTTRQLIDAVVSTRSKHLSSDEISSVVSWKQPVMYDEEIDSKITTKLRKPELQEVESIVSQHLEKLIIQRAEAIKFKDIASYLKELQSGCLEMQGMRVFDTKLKGLYFSKDAYKLDKLPKFAMYEVILQLRRFRKVQLLRQEFMDKAPKRFYINIEVFYEKVEKDSNIPAVKFSVRTYSKEIFNTTMKYFDITKKEKEREQYPDKVASERDYKSSLDSSFRTTFSDDITENEASIIVNTSSVDKVYKDTVFGISDIFKKVEKSVADKESSVKEVERYLKDLYLEQGVLLSKDKSTVIDEDTKTFIKEHLTFKLEGISKDAINKITKDVEKLVDDVLLDLYGRWYFLSDEGPYDEMIVPSEDYDYKQVPVKGRSEHPFPQGSDLATQEISVPINIISNVIDFFKEVQKSYGAFYRNVIPQQALTHFVTTVYDWVTVYIPQNIDKIPEYYSQDEREVIPNDKTALEDYQRIYRWVRWYAEGIVNNISEEDKKLLVGDKYVTMLVTELENYYNLHHGVYKRNFLAVNDKEKGVRHKILHSLKTLIHKESVGLSHKYLPKNEEYVRNRWMEGGRK